MIKRKELILFSLLYNALGHALTAVSDAVTGEKQRESLTKARTALFAAQNWIDHIIEQINDDNDEDTNDQAPNSGGL